MGFIKKLENDMFSGCGSLREVRLPNTIESIGDDAFEDCASLTSFECPLAVKSIGSSAFKGCAMLTYLELSNGLKKIGGSAFAKCPMLREIRSNAALAPKVEKSTFKDVLKQGIVKLAVPKGCMSIYKADKVWVQFRHMSEISLQELRDKSTHRF